jgi:hypothetical protein
MVKRILSLPRSLNKYLELFLYRSLTDVLGKRTRPNGTIEICLVARAVSGNNSILIKHLVNSPCRAQSTTKKYA